MKHQNSSVGSLAIVSWASIFLEAWLILLRFIPSDGITWGFFISFFIIAVMTSAIASAPSKKDGVISANDLIIKLDGKVYSVKDGSLFIGPERPDGMFVCILNKEKAERVAAPAPEKARTK